MSVSLIGRMQHKTCLHNGSSTANPNINDCTIKFFFSEWTFQCLLHSNERVFHHSLTFFNSNAKTTVYTQCFCDFIKQKTHEWVSITFPHHIVSLYVWCHTVKALLTLLWFYTPVLTPLLNYKFETFLYPGLKAQCEKLFVFPLPPVGMSQAAGIPAVISSHKILSIFKMSLKMFNNMTHFDSPNIKGDGIWKSCMRRMKGASMKRSCFPCSWCCTECLKIVLYGSWCRSICQTGCSCHCWVMHPDSVRDAYQSRCHHSI